MKVKTPTPTKTAERQFGELNEYMVELMSRMFENQVIKGLQVSTVNKFKDANQVGNYARVFNQLSNRLKRKILKRFSNKRLESISSEFLSKLDKQSQAKLYSAMEESIGISSKQLVLKESLRSTKNALILETAQWMKKLRDETLEMYTANTLRAMTQGKGVDSIMQEFKGLKEKRLNHAKFTARNQVNNFNSIMTKTRARDLGIRRARWVTAGDERVRASHDARDGKEFNLDEGLYSSVDGKTLLPATDYQCRCTYELIIEEPE